MMQRSLEYCKSILLTKQVLQTMNLLTNHVLQTKNLQCTLFEVHAVEYTNRSRVPQCQQYRHPSVEKPRCRSSPVTAIIAGLTP